MHPTAIQIGPLAVQWYGVMMAIGVLVGLWTASRRGLRDGLSPETVMDIGPWLLIGTIVGARFLHVVTYWKDDFAGEPWWEIFMVQKGGLVFYGGLVGASLTCIIFVRRKRIPLWKMADALAPSIALGYVFGRIGCLMSGCCFGRQCALPWAIQFPPASPAAERHLAEDLIVHGQSSLPVHPSQIYDSLLSLGLYLGLAWLYRRKRFDGQVFAAYLVCYAVTRSVVEMFRGDYTDPHLHSGLTPAHLISIGIFAAGIALLWILKGRKPLQPS